MSMIVPKLPHRSLVQFDSNDNTKVDWAERISNTLLKTTTLAWGYSVTVINNSVDKTSLTVATANKVNKVFAGFAAILGSFATLLGLILRIVSSTHYQKYQQLLQPVTPPYPLTPRTINSSEDDSNEPVCSISPVLTPMGDTSHRSKDSSDSELFHAGNLSDIPAMSMKALNDSDAPLLVATSIFLPNSPKVGSSGKIKIPRLNLAAIPLRPDSKPLPKVDEIEKSSDDELLQGSKDSSEDSSDSPDSESPQAMPARYTPSYLPHLESNLNLPIDSLYPTLSNVLEPSAPPPSPATLARLQGLKVIEQETVRHIVSPVEEASSAEPQTLLGKVRGFGARFFIEAARVVKAAGGLIREGNAPWKQQKYDLILENVLPGMDIASRDVIQSIINNVPNLPLQVNVNYLASLWIRVVSAPDARKQATLKFYFSNLIHAIEASDSFRKEAEKHSSQVFSSPTLDLFSKLKEFHSIAEIQAEPLRDQALSFFQTVLSVSMNPSLVKKEERRKILELAVAELKSSEAYKQVPRPGSTLRSLIHLITPLYLDELSDIGGVSSLDIATEVFLVNSIRDASSHDKRSVHRQFLKGFRSLLLSSEYLAGVQAQNHKAVYSRSVDILQGIAYTRFREANIHHYTEGLIKEAIGQGLDARNLPREDKDIEQATITEQFEAIKNIPSEFGAPRIGVLKDNLLTALNLGDPHQQGNLPYKLYTLPADFISGCTHPIDCLRMGMPMVHSSISPEFEAYLQCLKARGETHLYVNLQYYAGDPRIVIDSTAENTRSIAIRDLETKFPGTFSFVTLAQDSEFYAQEGKKWEHPELDAEFFIDRFMEQLLDNTGASGFYFPRELRESENFEANLRDLMKLVKESCFEGKNDLSLQDRKDFIEVYYAFLTLHLLKVAKPGSFNLSCKDAIDRAGKLNALVFQLIHTMQGTIDQPEHQAELRAITHAPALMAKKQKIVEGRMKRLLSARALLENAKVKAILQQLGPMFLQPGAELKIDKILSQQVKLAT